MPWKIGHLETEPDGTVHVTRIDWHEPEEKDENGKVTKRASRETHQLQTAIVLPPSGPGRGQATAALKQIAKDLRKAPTLPDVYDVEDAMNAGGDG